MDTYKVTYKPGPNKSLIALTFIVLIAFMLCLKSCIVPGEDETFRGKSKKDTEVLRQGGVQKLLIMFRTLLDGKKSIVSLPTEEPFSETGINEAIASESSSIIQYFESIPLVKLLQSFIHGAKNNFLTSYYNISQPTLPNATDLKNYPLTRESSDIRISSRGQTLSNNPPSVRVNATPSSQSAAHPSHSLPSPLSWAPGVTSHPVSGRDVNAHSPVRASRSLGMTSQPISVESATSHFSPYASVSPGGSSHPTFRGDAAPHYSARVSTSSEATTYPSSGGDIASTAGTAIVSIDPSLVAELGVSIPSTTTTTPPKPIFPPKMSAAAEGANQPSPPPPPPSAGVATIVPPPTSPEIFNAAAYSERSPQESEGASSEVGTHRTQEGVTLSNGDQFGPYPKGNHSEKFVFPSSGQNQPKQVSETKDKIDLNNGTIVETSHTDSASEAKAPQLDFAPEMPKDKAPQLDLAPERSKDKAPQLDLAPEMPKDKAPQLDLAPERSKDKAPQLDLADDSPKDETPQQETTSKDPSGPYPRGSHDTKSAPPPGTQDSSGQGLVCTPKESDSAVESAPTVTQADPTAVQAATAAVSTSTSSNVSGVESLTSQLDFNPLASLVKQVALALKNLFPAGQSDKVMKNMSDSISLLLTRLPAVMIKDQESLGLTMPAKEVSQGDYDLDNPSLKGPVQDLMEALTKLLAAMSVVKNESDTDDTSLPIKADFVAFMEDNEDLRALETSGLFPSQGSTFKLRQKLMVQTLKLVPTLEELFATAKASSDSIEDAETSSEKIPFSRFTLIQRESSIPNFDERLLEKATKLTSKLTDSLYKSGSFILPQRSARDKNSIQPSKADEQNPKSARVRHLSLPLGWDSHKKQKRNQKKHDSLPSTFEP